MATNDIGRVTPIWRGFYSAATTYELNDIVIDTAGSVWWHKSEELTTGVIPAAGEIWGAVIDMSVFSATIQEAIASAQAAVAEAQAAAGNISASVVIASDAAQNAIAAAQNAAESEASAGALAQAAEGSKDAAAGSAASAAGSATGAANSAGAAAGSKSDAEAYAVGTRGGEDVESDDPAYHNNAKYYSEQAGSSADAAAQSAEAAEDALESIPPDYSQLSGDVADLKTQTEDLQDAVFEGSSNIWDGTTLDGVRTQASSTQLKRDLNTVQNYKTAKVKITPGRDYSFVRSGSSYLGSLTSSQNIETSSFDSTNPITPANYTVIASSGSSSPSYVNFTADENAEYLYICYTLTGEDVRLEVYEGTYTDFVQRENTFYTKDEVDQKIEEEIGIVDAKIDDVSDKFDEFILVNEPVNLYANPMPGVRTVSNATKLQLYGTLANPDTDKLTARIAIQPNTKYSVLFSEPTDYIIIATASNEIKSEDFGSSNPISFTNGQIVGSDTSRIKTNFIFTSNENANYLYICSTIAGETDVNIFVGEGEFPEIPSTTTWVKWLDTYNKQYIDENLETKIDANNKFQAKTPMTIEASANSVNIYFMLTDTLYGRITISHEVDNSDAKYEDYWRIAQSALFSYDGTTFTATGKTLLIGAENEMAINFQGFGTFVGGWHGNERIDLDNDCYCVFIVDGKEFTISDLVSLGNITCDTFAYREVSKLYASYSYNTNHLPIANHTKLTTFENKGFTTKNYVGIDLANFDQDTVKVLTAFTGLFCISKDFADVAISDIGVKYTATHPVTTTTLAEEMNVFDLTAKTYKNEYSCRVDSKLINTNVESYKNPPVDVDMMDRQQDLKYYSYMPSGADLTTGDFLATEGSISWEIKD